MGMGPIFLEHRAIGCVFLEKDGSCPAVLGHKVDTLVSLARRDFVHGSLDRKDS